MAEHTARGTAAGELEDGRLLKELETIHRTRHETLLHGSNDALATHTQRLKELEEEYLRRHPRRATTAARTRTGARARTGAED
ncbi:hypothetical protein Slala03_28380 [Streptomyces lavendulae subsp. lavendulae]|uniref:DUF6158 family protein n=1 Tax=Streptomyces lavendulae TaxID=1914 RepID=UPI0024A2A096|nr:DUF6158 family protein [Streptomyces lavendulae]GLV83149.1 hypothetical protein Slala03_28380 [Streptomyces lavendulae subsp. lavendulae]